MVAYTTLKCYICHVSKKSTFPNIQSCSPQHCISGKMMKCNRIILQVFRKHIGRFGITNSQLSILFVTAKKETVTQRFLSEMLFLEKSTVSRNIRRLLKDGHISKDSKQQITMTYEGKILLEKVIPEWEKAMAEAKEVLKNEGEEALNLIFTNLTA